MTSSPGVAALFEARAAAHPGRTAWIARDETLSYGELNRRANRIAHALAAAPGSPDAPALLVFPPGAGGIAALLGAYKSGRAAVPIDPLHPADRLELVARSVGGAVVVTAAGAADIARALADATGSHLLDADGVGRFPETDPGRPVGLPSPACLLFTSGSTGVPKGVVQSHGMIVTQALAAADELSYREEDRCLVTGATTLGSGLSNVHQALVAGAAVAYFPIETEGLGALAGFIATTGVTVLHMVPSVFRRFLSTAGSSVRFPAVRLVRVSSDAVLRRDFELFRTHFPNAPSVRVNLALTETGTICSHLVPRDAVLADGALPVGPPVPGVAIELQDEEGRPVRAGETGEIVVRREWLADGYWRDPALTAERFPVAADGTRSCRTGDVARLRSDGTYEHVGRKDFQVKIRGVRVHLGEVEAALASVPGAGDVAAAAFTAPSGEKTLVGYFEGDPATVPPGPRVREILRVRLPAAGIPGAFVVLSEFPRTPTGKVNRRALPPPPPGAETADAAPPADEIEAALLEIWREILPGRAAGARDDFFDLGGHSLAAAEMLAAVERRFGRRLPLPILLDAPTIEALARVLRAPAPPEGSESPIVALQEAGSRVPFFCVPGGNGPGFNFRTIAGLLGDDQPFYAFHVVPEAGEPMPASIEEWADRFLPALRHLQPHGPYRLGGHSIGGSIAYAMATRLLDAGETVHFLALLDSFAPGFPRVLGPWERRLQIWRDFLGRPAVEKLRTVRRTIARAVERWRGHAGAASLPPAPRPFGGMTRAYAPRPLPIPLVLFRADLHASWRGVSFEDSDNGWRPIAGARLRTVVVPGTHDTLIEGGGAEAIAAVLGPLLAGFSAAATTGPRDGKGAEPRRAAS